MTYSNHTKSIHEIRPNQFHEIEGLIRESGLIDDLLSLDQAIYFLKNKLERNKVKIFAFANVDSSNFVAFVILVAKINIYSAAKYNWHVSYLYVQAGHRRQKIAHQLMSKCINYSLFTKVEQLTLNTGIDNLNAQKLYESMGFIRKDFLANYYYYEMNILSL